jgi:hypothetical protein
MLMSAAVFRQADFPRYIPGLWTTIALNIASIACCAIMSVYFTRRNKLALAGAVVNEGWEGFLYTL